MLYEKSIDTALNTVGKATDLLRSSKSDSLVQYTQPARAEPIVLLDYSIMNLPYMGEIMQAINSIFAGYYLQAVALSVNVGKIDVVRLLERLNPSRNPADQSAMMIGDRLLDMQSYRHRLPMPGENMSLEQFGFEDFKSGSAAGDTGHNTSATLGRDTISNAQEVANLSVGILMDVQIEDQGHKASIPVSIRLIVSSIAPRTLNNILTNSEKDVSVKERYHAWRAGQLSFIKDLILCNDLIDTHRSTLMKDGSGVYAEILKRRNGNKLSTIMSGNPSVATASNIVVLSAQTVSELESTVGGKLANFKLRERIFKNTYLMLMVVVDPQWEHITIYTRGISIPTTLTVGEIKSNNKGKGIDVAEVLKAYQLGGSPTL
jgi:hypothetical protein